MRKGKLSKPKKAVVGKKAGMAKARSEMLQHDKKEEKRGAKGYKTRLKDAAL